MYRTLVFNSAFPDEWKFDENENPSAPGSRELVDALAVKLRPRVTVVSKVEQHEYYGWAFTTSTGGGTFYNVLNPGDDCYLTVSMDWYTLKALLFQRPSRSFDRYCDLLADALREIAEVSNIQSWTCRP